MGTEFTHTRRAGAIAALAAMGIALDVAFEKLP
jgi:hypothetical protein